MQLKRGRDAAGPVIRSAKRNAFTSYKRYTQENLVAAIRAVTEEGMKKAEACVKFGIPFTTLTRKMTWLCKTTNTELPKAKKKLRKIAPKISSENLVNVGPWLLLNYDKFDIIYKSNFILYRRLLQ